MLHDTSYSVVTAFLDFFYLLFAVNPCDIRSRFQTSSGVDLLQLTRKVNIKNTVIVKQIDRIIATYY